MQKYSFGVLFLICGAFLIAVGVILHLYEHPLACAVLLSIGSTIVAVVMVNFLWSKSGGEPVQRIIEEMRGASELFSDAFETGLRRVHHVRRVDYEEQHRLISTAKSVSILSLIFKVAESQELKRSFRKCVKNGGRIRILLSKPYMDIECIDKVPSPFRLRQYAEGDFGIDRMHREIKDTLKFLGIIKNNVKTDNPEKAHCFEYRVISKYAIYFSMTCIDDRLRVSHYSNKSRGVDSPTMLIEKVASPRSLLNVYMEEFEYLWDKAELVTYKRITNNQ